MIHDAPPVQAISLKNTLPNQLAPSDSRIKLIKVKESELQQHLAAYIRQNNVFGFHVPNGGKRHVAVAKKLKSEGVMAGVSDLIILQPDKRTIFVEVKVTGNGLQDSQKDFRDNVQSFGFEYHVITASNGFDAVEQLKRILHPSSFRGYSGAVR